MKKIALPALIFFLSMQSCTLFDEAEPQPAYLHIPDIDLSVQPGEGLGTENIEYAWVYNNSVFIGSYHLPVTLPVLAEGATEIRIDPGVKTNGLSFVPGIFPFYKRALIHTTLRRGAVDTIRPSTSYKDNTVFALIESFNSDNHLFTDELDGDAATAIEIVEEGALAGQSARLHVTEDNSRLIAGTDFDRASFETIPKNNTPVWIEVDYRNDIPVIIGVVGVDASGTPTAFPEFGINPKDDWSKIYLNITDIILDPDFVAYQFFIQVILPLNRTEGTAYIDNFKILHF